MPTPNTPTLFRPGETLVVTPLDDQDPEAVRLSGFICKFMKYEKRFNNYAVVQFAERLKPIFLRPEDLAREVRP